LLIYDQLVSCGGEKKLDRSNHFWGVANTMEFKELLNTEVVASTLSVVGLWYLKSLLAEFKTFTEKLTILESKVLTEISNIKNNQIEFSERMKHVERR